MTQYSQPFNEACSPKELSIYWDYGWAAVLNEYYSQPFKALVVGSTGLVRWENLNGEAQEFYCGVAGQLYPIRGKRILSGTTASNIYLAGGL